MIFPNDNGPAPKPAPKPDPKLNSKTTQSGGFAFAAGLFPLGQIVITIGAKKRISETEVLAALARQASI